MEILAFSGKMGSGKDYVSQKIICPILPKKNTIFVSFADHFKVESIVKDKMPRAEVFGWVERSTETRRILQRKGTEEGRMVFGDDIWVDTLIEWMHLYHSRGVERFIITDCRFTNEVNRLKELGAFLIRISASERSFKRYQIESKGDDKVLQSIMNHPSETDLDNYQFDNVILNNENDDVLKQLEDIRYNSLFGRL